MILVALQYWHASVCVFFFISILTKGQEGSGTQGAAQKEAEPHQVWDNAQGKQFKPYTQTLLAVLKTDVR